MEWNNEENNRCYVDPTGNKLRGLNCIDEKWYYFDENGYLLTGWQNIDEKTYYFSLETGERYENGTFSMKTRSMYSMRMGCLFRIQMRMMDKKTVFQS